MKGIVLDIYTRGMERLRSIRSYPKKNHSSFSHVNRALGYKAIFRNSADLAGSGLIVIHSGRSDQTHLFLA